MRTVKFYLFTSISEFFKLLQEKLFFNGIFSILRHLLSFIWTKLILIHSKSAFILLGAKILFSKSNSFSMTRVDDPSITDLTLWSQLSHTIH